MALLEIINLEVSYGKACCLHNVSFTVEEGAIIAVIGPNGAGKSTLMDSIIGITDSHGQIIFDGIDLGRLSPTDIVRLRIAYAPEARNLFPYMSVIDNLLIGAYRAREDKEKNLEFVHELFPRLKERQNQEVRTLSGGEQQMVSLGRAFMSSPKLLLVDEPTIGLAPLICTEISRVLKLLNKTKGITILLAEQNVNFALTIADEIYLMETGRIKMKGTAEELQQDEYIQESYFGL